MDHHTFELTVNRAVQDVLDELFHDQTPGGTISRQHLEAHLQSLSACVQAASRDYYLESLCTSDELADELGVSVDHMCELARHRFFNYGIGRQLGETWVWTPEEVEILRPQGE